MAESGMIGGPRAVAGRAAGVRVAPMRGIPLPGPTELWEHRQVLAMLVWRNVVRRYRQTLLGPFWFIIRPLMRMVVFSLVLGRIAGLSSEGVPYPLFTYAALLPWELFSSGMSRGTSCFVSYHHIVSKVYFPRLLVPTAEVITALVDFSLSFGILLAMMAYYGYWPTPRIFLLPLLLALTMALSLSLGLLLAALQARFRDISDMLGYLTSFWFYATPVAYSGAILTDRIPESLRLLYQLNPMNGIIEGFRWCLVGAGRPPDALFAVNAVLIVLLLLVSSIVFLRSEHSIVDLV